MELIDVGFWSILPPIIAIALALITKEVISSLMVGILSGGAIYAFYLPGGNFVGEILESSVFALTNRFSVHIVIFLAMLGGLVYVMTKAGGSKAYGEWATKRIKSKTGAALATSVLGVMIFIDDYFNCLTVGAVMKPVTDKFGISRAKLAYIIDSTAAPICIIAPVSSWAASVMAYMEGTGMNGMSAFLQAIPFNLYAILTIIMVVIIAVKDVDFGPMAKCEDMASKGDIGAIDDVDEQTLDISNKGRVSDLVLPVLALVIFSIIAMLYVGGYFAGGISLLEGFGNTDAAVAITYGALAAIIFTFFIYVPRGLLSFREFMEGIGKGVGTMTSATIILTLAWGMSSVCRDLLGTGEYVGSLVANSNLLPALIPAIIFVVAGFLAFSMGTSWGTFGILIPIVTAICAEVAPELMIIGISATLAGSVFGDHCSPISDTTILSSTGAGCDHILHVRTQMYYACTVAVCSMIGYIVAGFTQNLIITWIATLVSLGIIFMVMRKRKVVKKLA